MQQPAETREAQRDWTRRKLAWFVLLIAATVLVIVAIGIPKWLHNTDTDGYLALSDANIHVCWTLAFVFDIIGIVFCLLTAVCSFFVLAYNLPRPLAIGKKLGGLAALCWFVAMILWPVGFVSKSVYCKFNPVVKPTMYHLCEPWEVVVLTLVLQIVGQLCLLLAILFASPIMCLKRPHAAKRKGGPWYHHHVDDAVAPMHGAATADIELETLIGFDNPLYRRH